MLRIIIHFTKKASYETPMLRRTNVIKALRTNTPCYENACNLWKCMLPKAHVTKISCYGKRMILKRNLRKKYYDIKSIYDKCLLRKAHGTKNAFYEICMLQNCGIEKTFDMKNACI